MIVLFILKVLALILACLLALALFIAFLALSVPIKYRLNAVYNGKPDILIKAKWFFRIFTLTYETGGSPALKLKVFGRMPKHKGSVKSGSNGGSSGKGNDKNIGKEADEEETAKTSLVSRINEIKGHWNKFLEYKYKNLLVKKTLQLLKRLLKAIKPRYADGECHFGFDDPSVTGMLLGAAHALCGMAQLYRHIRLKADFEKKYLYFKCHAEGKIRLWSLLWPLVAYAVSKPVWIIIEPFIFKKRAKGRVV